MNYQPFLNMHVLLSDELLLFVKALFVFSCIVICSVSVLMFRDYMAKQHF